MTKIIIDLLGSILVAIILGIGFLGVLFLTHAVINSSESYFEGLGTIGGIIVSISFLILISLTENLQFKNLKYYKGATIFFSVILLFSLYFIIAAISINIFFSNITQAIYLLYGSVLLDALVLTGLISLLCLSLEA